MEENRLVQRAKRYLISKGMSEEDAHKYIIDYSMKNRITKMETAREILND
ncbi:MAG: ANTAR domain-containing protein [Acholeplasmatales bacterium]|nr:ANTAR domain-containing protein [Acholeplasmatales bacterium]